MRYAQGEHPSMALGVDGTATRSEIAHLDLGMNETADGSNKPGGRASMQPEWILDDQAQLDEGGSFAGRAAWSGLDRQGSEQTKLSGLRFHCATQLLVWSALLSRLGAGR